MWHGELFISLFIRKMWVINLFFVIKENYSTILLKISELNIIFGLFLRGMYIARTFQGPLG